MLQRSSSSSAAAAATPQSQVLVDRVVTESCPALKRNLTIRGGGTTEMAKHATGTSSRQSGASKDSISTTAATSTRYNPKEISSVAQRGGRRGSGGRFPSANGTARPAPDPAAAPTGPSTVAVRISRGIYRCHQIGRTQTGRCQGDRRGPGRGGKGGGTDGGGKGAASHPATIWGLRFVLVPGTDCPGGGGDPIAVSGQRCRDVSLDYLRGRSVLPVCPHVGFYYWICTANDGSCLSRDG